ncbi:MAG: D-cysteine desulfhydrase family protein [Spirochaetota bacterium]
MLFRDVPRYDLGFSPTPIHPLPRLSAALGGPELWIKRDDQTGLAGGGNKTRKLEFSLGEALARGADTLVTLGGVQSNHCRQTAAAAARAGLSCVLVLRGEAPAERNGNLLLDHLLGAQVVFSGGMTREEKAREVLHGLASKGRKPFLIPLGASDEYGAPGYVLAARELADQFKTLGFVPDRLVLASSSCGTQAGLCLGFKALGERRMRVTAINIDSKLQELQETVAGLVGKTARRLSLDVDVKPQEVLGYDGYLGGGYAVLGAPETEAIGLAARTEGLLLDPVYTGRAMAGLVDLVRKGEFAKGERILFLHTGGSPALYAYASQLLEDHAASKAAGYAAGGRK